MLETAEERSEYARWLASRRKPENMARRGRRHGTAVGWTWRSAKVARAAATIEAEQLIKKLIVQGAIAKDDTQGIAATKEALIMVRCPGETRARRRAAKKLLAFYEPELAGML
ncbi:hypothetical protein [Sphingobium estronivorans]|uniref:hypothetical protein n=1 Tax=Sphingobium estronivorans TaxID=1577690 RepID=UPI00123AA8DB|nr:hypothetical protein [Sphingobium estronivorans]